MSSENENGYELNREQIAIMQYTEKHNLFAEDSKDMQILVSYGFMKSLRKGSFIQDGCFGLTPAGFDWLNG